MPDRNADNVQARRTWQPHPALYKRGTRIGQEGEFFTTVTLSVPAKTALDHITGIRLGLSNGRGGCFTTFHSLEELQAFIGWLTEQSNSQALTDALKLSAASQVVTI